MSCLSSARRAEITAEIAKKEAQLANAEASYEKALNEDTASYRFDSGEGSQRLQARKLQEWADVIDRLQARIDSLKRKLAGTGLLNMRVWR